MKYRDPIVTNKSLSAQSKFLNLIPASIFRYFLLIGAGFFVAVQFLNIFYCMLAAAAALFTIWFTVGESPRQVWRFGARKLKRFFLIRGYKRHEGIFDNGSRAARTQERPSR